MAKPIWIVARFWDCYLRILPNRRFAGCTLLLLWAMFYSAPSRAAEIVHVPLQTNTDGWRDGQLQPTVDGHIDPIEYANGMKVELNDFSNTVRFGNGELYLTVTDRVVFTRQQCRRIDDSPCKGGTIFIGLRLHSATREIGQERGQIDIFFDTRRHIGERERGCDRQGGVALPNSDDRKFTIDYASEPGQDRLALVLAQYQGGCRDGWRAIVGDNGLLERPMWNVSMSGRELLGSDDGANSLIFEFALTIEPSAPTNLIAAGKAFGLAVLHQVDAPYGSFGHFPSLYRRKPEDQDISTWATVELKTPPRLPLTFTSYNVGHLESGPDGGQGQAEDIAEVTYRSDVACLVEEMKASERDAVVKAINRRRRAVHLHPMTPIYPGNGDPPNHVLLVAGPVIDSDFVLFGDLPRVTTYCADKECAAKGPGYKGITWARVGIQPATVDQSHGLTRWASEHFIDIFCTHAQSDYKKDGHFAEEQWCNASNWLETIAALLRVIEADCVKTSAAPPERTWSVNVREEQWKALKAWSDEKRKGGRGSPNGLDRPAFLLGDLNQIGLKAVSSRDPNGDIEAWVRATGFAFGPQYRRMRTLLGNRDTTRFETVNGWAWNLYDLLARQSKGTWIGQRTESLITKSNSTHCIGGIGGPSRDGYDPERALPQEARADYIMILPARADFPFYAITGPDRHPQEPLVRVHANAGAWTDGDGCLSDHAQVSAEVGLAPIVHKAHYNPMKRHRFTYRISHVWDTNNADHGDTDWYVAEPDFAMERQGAGGRVVERIGKGYPDGSTRDGVAVPILWFDSVSVADGETALSQVVIRDHDSWSRDDRYNGNNLNRTMDGRSALVFEFDHAYPGSFYLMRQASDPLRLLVGTVDPSIDDPQGACRIGCLGVQTVGNDRESDADLVQVSQNLFLEEID